MARQPEKPKNIAEAIPRPLVEHEVSEDGLVKLLVPRFRSRWMQWLQKRLKHPYIRVGLDEIGSSTWKLIDGRRTIREIGAEMHTLFGEKVEPVAERLGLFFGTLKRNKFVDWESMPEEMEGAVRPR